MIFDMLNDNDLIKLISSDLFNYDELLEIERVLKHLFDAEEKFNIFYNTLTTQQAYLLEENGRLFPKEHPFCPMFWLDDEKHQTIIAYMIMANIGFMVSGTNHAFQDYNPFDDDEKLKPEVIKLL